MLNEAMLLNESGFVDIAEKSDFSEESENKKTKTRLKTSSRQVDWPVLIERIIKDTGCSMKDIAEATGMSRGHIANIKCEVDPYSGGDKTIALLGVYLMNTKRDIPLLGDHNEV